MYPYCILFIYVCLHIQPFEIIRLQEISRLLKIAKLKKKKEKLKTHQNYRKKLKLQKNYKITKITKKTCTTTQIQLFLFLHDIKIQFIIELYFKHLPESTPNCFVKFMIDWELRFVFKRI